MEARLAHPVFDSVRQILSRLKDFSREELNALAQERKLRTESGKPVQFVPPATSDPYYEVNVFETGRVQTRPDSKHDLFNALAWLAFPKTKARINAMHAAEIPRERENSGGKRGRLRDMLTIFDEGGAIVEGDASIEQLVRDSAWETLFLQRHSDFHITVLGHAVMEQALAPYPGITCKVIFAERGANLDAVAAHWLATKGRTPKDMPTLPVFGYPGWYPGNGRAEFYAEARYFRRPGGHAAAR